MGILTSITIATAIADAKVPNKSEGNFRLIPKEAKLLKQHSPIVRDSGRIILLGGDYDIDGDGSPDIEAYFRVCDNKIISPTPYFVHFYKTGRFEVSPDLSGEVLVMQKREVDMEDVYTNAPKCP